MAFNKELSERARHEWASETHREGQQAPSPAGVASVPTVDAAAVLEGHRPVEYAVTASGLTTPLYSGLIRCIACWAIWRGDAETGGCEARLLAREVVALEEFITRLLASHRGLEGLVCQEFGGDTTDSDALEAEWSALRAPRTGDGGGG